MVFDNKWFEERQKYLLFFCNNKYTKKIFRYILRIQDDIKLSDEIFELQPNNFKFKTTKKVYDFGFSKWTNKTVFKADFRTHDKFGKRLFYTFKYYWYLKHFIDWILLDRYVPKLSFGYSTATFYPQVGGGGANVSCDGRAYYFNASGGAWSTARSTCTGAEVVATEGNLALIRCDGDINKWDVLQRGFKSFDISSWSGTITSAYLGIKSWDNAAYGTDTIGSQSISFVQSTQVNANTVATGDFTRYNTTKLANDYLFSSLTRNTYEIINLNSAGITYVSGTTVPKFCILITSDLANSEPTWGSGNQATWNAYNADATGTTSDPKLVLTSVVVTNFQLNIGDSWKTVTAIKINIGDSWKDVTSAKVNIGDSWKTIF